ncbi:insulinase family protein [Chondromyces crocatus]|uniref:Peptidase M16 C-terminal domain-containing protein n=1 Tax=Chondromyces crocatus TaxID=52 RepID=A0A0K1ETE6_CHOCO|nr:insulinase family protein [Chondromyces crocatus]AKT43908.1 uncharacterized protein CMC5_081450 [Chondromyces crocatus]
MARMGLCMVVALGLSGCGSVSSEQALPASPPASAPQGVVRGEAAVAGGGASRDARPSVPPLKSLVAPRVEAFRSASGHRVFVVERDEGPHVHVMARLQWPASAYKAELITGGLLLEATRPGSARTVFSELLELEARPSVNAEAEVALVSATLSRDSLAQGLRALLGAFSAAARVSPEAFEQKRKERLGHLAQERLSTDMMRLIDEGLFGPTHPYQQLAREETVLRSLKLADVQRVREAQLQPEALRLVLVGDVSAAEVQATLASLGEAGRPASATAATKAAAPKASAPRTPLVRGAALIEEPGATYADVAVVLPLQGYAAIPAPLVRGGQHAIVELLSNAVFPWSEGKKAQLMVGNAHREEHSFLIVGARVLPDAVVDFVKAVRGVMASVAKAVQTEEVLQRMQRDVGEYASEVLKHGPALATTLALLEDPASNLERTLADHDPAQGLTPEVLRERALAWLRWDQVRVVAAGNVAGSEKALVDLGFEPVTLRTRTLTPRRKAAGESFAASE